MTALDPRLSPAQLAMLWMSFDYRIAGLRQTIRNTEAEQAELGPALANALSHRLPAIPPGLKGYDRTSFGVRDVMVKLSDGRTAGVWFYLHPEEDRWVADDVVVYFPAQEAAE